MVFALVQATSGHTAGGFASLTLTFGSNITAGHGIVICTMTSGDTVSSFGTADTFVKATGDSSNTSLIYYASSSAGGYNAITINYAYSGFGHAAYAYEVSGGILLDRISSNRNSNPTSVYTSNATSVTAQANEFWVGCVQGVASVSGTTVSGASGWTNETAYNGDFVSTGPTYEQYVSGYQIASSTGSATYSGSFSAAQANGAYASVATFQPSASIHSILLAFPF